MDNFQTARCQSLFGSDCFCEAKPLKIRILGSLRDRREIIEIKKNMISKISSIKSETNLNKGRTGRYGNMAIFGKT